MFYRIGEFLEVCDKSILKTRESKYVALLTTSEWAEMRDLFDMGIEQDLDIKEGDSTKAEVNYDSLTGTFSVPDRNDLSGKNSQFAFALDEKGIVFIDDSGYAQKKIEEIRSYKKQRMPSLERFIYDFLEQIIYEDSAIIQKFDYELDAIEQGILLGGLPDEYPVRISEIRTDIRDLRVHYEQLLDMAQELEENENEFFDEDNLRYFRLVEQRIGRLRDKVLALTDYTMQVRELYEAQLDLKQNRIMTILTVVTTIFMPLTLIAGWYGMNFVYMPELKSRLGYPVVIVVCLLIVVFSLIFFKKKKWL